MCFDDLNARPLARSRSQAYQESRRGELKSHIFRSSRVFRPAKHTYVERNILDLKKLFILLPFGTFPFEERAIYGVSLASDSMEWSAFPFFNKERQRLFTQFFTIGDFPIQFSVYTSCPIHHECRVEFGALKAYVPSPPPLTSTTTSPVTDPQSVNIQYFILLLLVAKVLTPAVFAEKTFILVCHPWFQLNSALLWPFIPNDLFLVYLSPLQQTSATSCGALDVLMFAKDSI